MKEYKEEVETRLLGERAVQGLGRKPSTWLAWFPGAWTGMIIVHSPGGGPGGHACQSPESEDWVQGQESLSWGKKRSEQSGARVG